MKKTSISLEVTNDELQVLAGALSCYASKEDLPENLSTVTEMVRSKVKGILKKTIKRTFHVYGNKD